MTRTPGWALALLSLALVLSMSVWFSASAVVPRLQEAWGLTRGEAAWLTIAVQLGFVVGAVLSSVLTIADVVSPRLVILGGSLGAAAANALVAAAGGLTSALPARFLTGVFLAGVYPPALKLMATWFRRGRGTALGVIVGALTVGSAAPYLVRSVGGIGWQTVILVTSALTVLGGLVVVATVPEGPYPFPRARFDPRQARLVVANRGVRLTSIGFFGHMWELYAMWAWFLVYAQDVLFTSAGAAALATFVVIGVGGVGCVAGGVLGDRLGRPAVTAWLMGISGACALLIGLVPRWVALPLALVWGFTVVADSAQFSALVTEYADQAYVGTALALQLAAGFMLTVATIWLIPVVESAVGWRYAFSLLAIGPAIGIVAMMRLYATERATA